MSVTKPSTPSPDLYRAIVESIRDYAVFLLDREGRVLTWNPGAERIKGYTAEEIVGENFARFYPPEDRERGMPEEVLRLAATEGHFEQQAWRVRKDGTRFWANVVVTPLRDRAGGIRGFVKVTRDMSEWKRLDDQRRALEAVTEDALGHLDLDALLAAMLGRITAALAVDTATVLLRADEENVLVARAAKGLEEEVERGIRIPVGRGFAGRVAAEARPVVIPDVERADVLNPILGEKGVRSLLGVPLVFKGRVLGVLHVGSLRQRAFEPSEVQFLQIVADRMALAVEHARLYEEARRARSDAEAAEAALRMRDEFLSVAAHELKTPMTSAKIGVQFLRRTLRSASLSATQALALDRVDQQITRLSRLVVQLLDTVRLQGGRLLLDVEDVDLAELVRETADEARALSDRHEIVVDAPDTLHARVDALRIQQVLLNLLDNAVKFMPDGGPIDVRLVRGPTTAIMSVRDRGVGVPPEHHARLFDRFYQAHRDRSGMGLGLYIARQIVERHGGTIYAESPPDGGTRFVMSVPVQAQLVPLHSATA